MQQLSIKLISAYWCCGTVPLLTREERTHIGEQAIVTTDRNKKSSFISFLEKAVIGIAFILAFTAFYSAGRVLLEAVTNS